MTVSTLLRLGRWMFVLAVIVMVVKMSSLLQYYHEVQEQVLSIWFLHVVHVLQLLPEPQFVPKNHQVVPLILFLGYPYVQ